MTYMNAIVGVSKINPDPAKCVMLTTQRSVTVSGLGSYDVRVNGDIVLQVKNQDAIEGTNIKFSLNDMSWELVTARPIVIAPATGEEGCVPTATASFPPGIGYTQNTTPGPRELSVTLPKADMSNPVEYHYWLQVMKPGNPGSAKWVHPKIRNDTISSFVPRNPFFHYFVEHPLIGVAAIVAALLAAAAIGFYAGRKR